MKITKWIAGAIACLGLFANALKAGSTTQTLAMPSGTSSYSQTIYMAAPDDLGVYDPYREVDLSFWCSGSGGGSVTVVGVNTGTVYASIGGGSNYGQPPFSTSKITFITDERAFMITFSCGGAPSQFSAHANATLRWGSDALP